jgi:hypothetical protein
MPSIKLINGFMPCRFLKCNFFCPYTTTVIPNLSTGFFVHKRTISAVKRVEFVCDRMSYIILRGRWFHIIVLNVHALTEDNTDYVKDSFHEELEHIFDKFPKYHIKILLGISMPK